MLKWFVFFSALSQAAETSLSFKGYFETKAWANGGALSNIAINDFQCRELFTQAITLSFESEKKKLKIYLDDSSLKYSDKKLRLNVTILLPESSLDFQKTSSGVLSGDVYLGDGFSFPRNKSELSEKILAKIREHLASSLSRKSPGFIWQTSDDSLNALRSFSIVSDFYRATLLQCKRIREKQGGGVMEFEVIADRDLKVLGSRVTNELVID